MLNLTREELLVLFEFCYRICETNKIAISHHAEAVVIDKIAGHLEWSLSEPFQEDYTNILNKARDNILQEYSRRMGEHSWVEKIPLEQV